MTFLSPGIFLIICICVHSSIQGSFNHEVCTLPLDEGKTCSKGKPQEQHYFDTKTDKCKVFKYKGCGGNKNRFQSDDDCTDSCQVETLAGKNKETNSQLESNEVGSVEDCNLPKDSGPCKAAIEQWYFDYQIGECKKFVYGGCKGNKNRFKSEELCKNTCLTNL